MIKTTRSKRALTLIAADLIAVAAAAGPALVLTVAMRRPTEAGSNGWSVPPPEGQWHGWSTLLVLTVLFGAFAISRARRAAGHCS